MANVRAAGAVIAILLSAAPSSGQGAAPDAAEPTSSVQGSFDVGYRWRSIEGSEDSFRQLFDLTEGPRVLGFDLHGAMAKGANGLTDAFAVTASGLGGDPFPTLQINMSKARRYNLSVNWRRSRLFNFAPATPASIGGFDTRVVTDRHSWTTARQIGNAALTFDVTNRFHVLFNYERMSNSGSIETTRSLDYVGASSVWAGFARANAYALVGPTDSSSDRATAGFSYVRDRWTLNYKAGVQRLSDHQTFEPLAPNQRSINIVDAATAGEPLAALTWSQKRTLRASASELLFVIRPTQKLEWRSQYMFYRYRGPFNLDAAYRGTARANSGATAYAPYDIAQTTSGTSATPSHVVEQGLTWRPIERWSFDATYRYAKSSNTADATLDSVARLGTAAPIATTEAVLTTWRNTLQSLKLSATWTPVSALTLRPGVRLVHRDVKMTENEVIEPGATKTEQSVWPEIVVGYRPNSRFSARGSYQTSHSDTSYTRMSPVERATGRIVLHFELRPELSVEVSANRVDAELTDASFVSHTRSGAVTLTYAVSHRFSVTGGFDYQSFLGTGDGTFLRGAQPIANLALHDREIDRVWQGGVIVKPTDALGIVASGNFARTTGLDQIFGEPALYGAVSFPYATGTVYYDVSRVGRIALDLQRTTLTQDILSANNFRANMLTLRYSRAF